MSATLLITAIIAYILSLVISLVLMIVSRKVSDSWKKGIIIFHSILLLICLLSFLFFKTNSGIIFLVFFCAGVAIAGMIIRSSLNLLLKMYYSVFLLSVIIFLYSPSLLFSLLAQQKFPDKKRNEFLLTDNYYLVKEKSMLEISNEFVNYKIVKRMGQFNKTMQRNISFQYAIDSVKVLNFEEGKQAKLRVYFLKENNISDSADISAPLIMKDENEIRIQRK